MISRLTIKATVIKTVWYIRQIKKPKEQKEVQKPDLHRDSQLHVKGSKAIQRGKQSFQ